MRILAVDTSSKSCSVCIVEDTWLRVELTMGTGATHSKHLMDLIQKAVSFAGVNLSELDGFAVTKGPGSFTGLRIGISSVKGLAVAVGKPIVGISSLDVLASQCALSSCLICPLLDARKGEVYFSLYVNEDGKLKKKTEEWVCSPEKAIENIQQPCAFIGDGAYLYHLSIIEKLGSLAHFVPRFQGSIRASTLAAIALIRFDRNETDDVALLVPSYVRKSDAEINLGE